jgi:hypothetical protein
MICRGIGHVVRAYSPPPTESLCGMKFGHGCHHTPYTPDRICARCRDLIPSGPDCPDRPEPVRMTQASFLEETDP